MQYIENKLKHNLEFKRLSSTATLPTRGSLHAGGYDLYASELVGFIVGNDSRLVSTGIAVKIPTGYVGIIKPRSGLAVKHGFDIGAGVIDSDYRGEIKVLMRKHNLGTYTVGVGDRIAQIVIVPCLEYEPVFVDELNSTTRGESGFGSTGV